MIPPGETVFFTFRLHGTVPAATTRELQTELRQAQKAGVEHRRAQKQFFVGASSLPLALSGQPAGVYVVHLQNLTTPFTLRVVKQ